MLLWLGEIDRYRKRRDEGTLHGWPRPNSELLKKRKRSPFFPWSQRSRGAAASRRRVTRFMAWPQSRRLLVRSRSAQGRIWLWCEFGSSGSYRLACIVLVYGSGMLLYAVVCCCVLLLWRLILLHPCVPRHALSSYVPGHEPCAPYNYVPTSAEWNQSINACHHAYSIHTCTHTAR